MHAAAILQAMIYKALGAKTPSTFRMFFQSTLFDRLLHTILLYFTATFQHDWIDRTMERSRKQRLEGK